MIERRPHDRARVAEALAAGTAADCLRHVLVRVQSTPTLQFTVEGSKVPVPRRAASMFVDLLEDLSEGREVTIAPANLLVGTTEASRVLGVSRTWTARLVDDGKLASEYRGTKRRVRLGSLMAWRRSEAARLRRASKRLAESLEAFASTTTADLEETLGAELVARPRPDKLTPEHSTYMDMLRTSETGAVPSNAASAGSEPALAA